MTRRELFQMLPLLGLAPAVTADKEPTAEIVRVTWFDARRNKIGQTEHVPDAQGWIRPHITLHNGAELRCSVKRCRPDLNAPAQTRYAHT